MISFNSPLSKFESDLWGYHIPIPEKIVDKLSDGTNRRVKCVLDGRLTINSALMPSGEYWFILVNKQIRNNLNLTIGKEVNIEIEKDRTEYGMPMPDVFSALLSQDEQGSQFFHSLTPGKQRSLIYIVSKVKNIDSRLNKGLAILDHLKTSGGKLDFKQLNVLIKDYNQRAKLNRI